MGKTLIITEQGSVIGIKAGMLTIGRGGEAIETFKPFELEQLVLMGKVDMTNAAITMVLKHGVDCVFLTRNGSFKGRLAGRESKNILLRLAQFQMFADPLKAAAISASIVSGKVLNQRALLMRVQRKIHSAPLARTLTRMRIISKQVYKLDDVDTIRGMEGEAAKAYFQYFGRMILNPAFFFNGRNRRPPKDPVNACLSFGYTMLQTVVEGIVMEAGFDPYLGVLHAPVYGRPSLVLDLMEEFRPVVVDAVTLSLINLRQMTPSDFGPPHQDDARDIAVNTDLDDLPVISAVYMKQGSLKIFIMAFLNKLRTVLYYPHTEQRLSLRQIIRAQTYQLARVVKGEKDVYRPFTMS